MYMKNSIQERLRLFVHEIQISITIKYYGECICFNYVQQYNSQFKETDHHHTNFEERTSKYFSFFLYIGKAFFKRIVEIHASTISFTTNVDICLVIVRNREEFWEANFMMGLIQTYFSWRDFFSRTQRECDFL